MLLRRKLKKKLTRGTFKATNSPAKKSPNYTTRMTLKIGRFGCKKAKKLKSHARLMNVYTI